MSTSTENERWGIAASAPPLNPAEVESHHRAVEVVVMWGDDVLHVEHVSPPRDVRIDTSEGTHPVVIEREGRLFCVLPEGSSGDVRVGEERRSLDEIRGPELAGLDELAGAVLYPLPEGGSAKVTHDGLTFLVRPTHAGKELAGAAEVKWRRYGWVALSLGVHALFLAMFYFMPPSSQALSLDQINADARMVEYLNAATATEDIELPEWDQGDAPSGGDGERHADEEGAAGDPEEAVTHNRQAVERRNDSAPTMSRHDIEENMASSTAIGAVASLMGSWNAPTSPYGAEQANGLDAMNAIGELMGDQVGMSWGNRGLGMHGTGRGAGGTGLGTYGLGTLGTLGRGSGGGTGDGYGPGYGTGTGPLHGRRARTPVVPRSTGAVIRGGLSREAIRRVVQRNLNQVRFCYEQGLAQNPSIEGRVTVQWIISPTGAVTMSGVSSSSLNNQRVESCISDAVGRWTFPQPEGGGTVGVNYPFLLQSPD